MALYRCNKTCCCHFEVCCDTADLFDSDSRVIIFRRRLFAHLPTFNGKCFRMHPQSCRLILQPACASGVRLCLVTRGFRLACALISIVFPGFVFFFLVAAPALFVSWRCCCVRHECVMSMFSWEPSAAKPHFWEDNILCSRFVILRATSFCFCLFVFLYCPLFFEVLSSWNVVILAVKFGAYPGRLFRNCQHRPWLLFCGHYRRISWQQYQIIRCARSFCFWEHILWLVITSGEPLMTLLGSTLAAFLGRVISALSF